MILKHYFSMHLKTQMQYKVSFFFIFLSQFLSIFLELFVILSLFEKFSLLEEYNRDQMILVFGVVWAGMSLAETFGRGFDHFGNLIRKGDFDLLLLRPRNLYIQVIGNEIAYEKIARVLCSLGMIFQSLFSIPNMNGYKVFVIVLLVFSSFLLFLSMFIIGSTLCFWTTEGLEVTNIFTDGTRQLGQYPMSIYHKIVFYIFTILIPLTVVNYYPILYLFQETNLFYSLLPLVIIPFFLFSLFCFHLGLRHYKSTGS